MSFAESKMTLKDQVAFYETIRDRLEAESWGKWAVVANGRLIGVYDTNPEASEVAMPLLKLGPCLVRRIGRRAEEISMRRVLVRG